MKFTAALSVTALVAVVAAVPATPDSPPNVKVAAEIPKHFGSLQGLPSVIQEGASPAKRNLEKRANLNVEVWADTDKGGRHQSLWTNTNQCYNLYNGWEDQISSLSVPWGFGCIFYRHRGCGNSDFRLNVPGGNYIANLQGYGFNDIISSYLCWN